MIRASECGLSLYRKLTGEATFSSGNGYLEIMIGNKKATLSVYYYTEAGYMDHLRTAQVA
jgi:hypothetical protein